MATSKDPGKAAQRVKFARRRKKPAKASKFKTEPMKYSRGGRVSKKSEC
jgi:hypothetical protein